MSVTRLIVRSAAAIAVAASSLGALGALGPAPVADAVEPVDYNCHAGFYQIIERDVRLLDPTTTPSPYITLIEDSPLENATTYREGKIYGYTDANGGGIVSLDITSGGFDTVVNSGVGVRSGGDTTADGIYYLTINNSSQIYSFDLTQNPPVRQDFSLVDGADTTFNTQFFSAPNDVSYFEIPDGSGGFSRWLIGLGASSADFYDIDNPVDTTGDGIPDAIRVYTEEFTGDPTIPTGVFGATWTTGFGQTDSNGNPVPGELYAFHNQSGDIVRVVLNDSDPTIDAPGNDVVIEKVYDSTGAASNDGMSCPTGRDGTRVESFDRDYGDLPASYPEAQALATPLMRLGATLNAFPTATTTFDPGDTADSIRPYQSTDAAGDIGDDGVTVTSYSGAAPKGLQGARLAANDANSSYMLAVPNGSGYISAWIDTNRDGDFGPGEQFEADKAAAGSTSVPINFDLTSVGEGLLNIRFRLAGRVGGAASGLHSFGEIEDYQVRLTNDIDGDGIPNPAEPAADVDNDGLASAYDADANGDGIPDTLQSQRGYPRMPAGADGDGDGIDDAYDPDNCTGLTSCTAPSGVAINDPDPSTYEPPSDRDGDGASDAVEAALGDPAGSDVDGDGIDDAYDPDSTAGLDLNNDRLIDIIDSDGDRLTDYRDGDSDNDGIADAVEGRGDVDADGIPSALDADADGNGIFDTIESGSVALDADRDGVLDNGSDSDADGVVDMVDAAPNESENNSSNVVLGDADGDGRPDIFDFDNDGDGLTDIFEIGLDPSQPVNTDGDGDGDPDFSDLDSDGDGLGDDVEGADDPDGDGRPNFRDLDSDGDGISDADEGRGDADGDGISDGLDTDADNNQIPDREEGSGDRDGDGRADFVDFDNDNDGIDDLTEGHGDVDGDGIPADIDRDSDGDRLPDAYEGAADTDADAIPDAADVDADGDGIADRVEGAGDGDGDAIPDFRDSDSDNDGIPDAVEGSLDRDADGKPDFEDPDSDNDGIADAIEGAADTDGDGRPDFVDLDSDGDRIADQIEEVGDVDGDELPNFADRDSDGNGVTDGLEGIGDPDGDGIANYLDRDSDGDGLADVIEVGRAPAVDSDRDGTPDYLDRDSNGDGTPDLYDVDADGDGVLNRAEATFQPATIPPGRDTDGDGIGDRVEGTGDVDGDGAPNLNDLDSDGDGISDAVEAAAGARSDRDADGVPNYLDRDADGDGIGDAAETAADADGDGMPNYLDRDADGDGIVDRAERVSDADADGLPNYLDADSDGDGIADRAEGIFDTDGDGTPDYLDRDSDGDGQPDDADPRPRLATANNDLARATIGNDSAVDVASNDEFAGDLAYSLVSGGTALGVANLDASTLHYTPQPGEQGPVMLAYQVCNRQTAVCSVATVTFLVGPDSDGDGTRDAADLDDDNDGITDTNEGAGDSDSDSDGVPDSFDRDSDNDGITDLLEAGGDPNRDRNGDGTIDAVVDTDGDGLDDALAATPLPDTNSDADTVPDRLDSDSDDDGLADAVEVGPAILPVDLDGDGLADFRDQDADGDGIEDRVEGVGDLDGDGLADFRDQDVDGDGIGDRVEGVGDLDGDGLADFRDRDADGDGIDDRVEGAPTPDVPPDTNADRFPDFRDLDADGDGIGDRLEQGGDLDADGSPNFRDLDADGDGILDAVEAGPNRATPRDADGDGTPNFLDLDADGDGVNDRIEGVSDPDRDGIPSYLDVDSDGNGVLDRNERRGDLDGDGTDDRGDRDDDGDGISDRVELGTNPNRPADRDGDGTPNFSDSDSDNDRKSDAEGNGDPDGDRIPSYLDTDADGNGIGDNIDHGGDLDGDRIADFLDLDDDGDGMSDRDEIGSNPKSPRDDDGDGIGNYRDLPGVPLSGRVFRDRDRDGVRDAGEADISGVRVGLVAAGRDGEFATKDDEVIAITVTASPFRFDMVLPGRYAVIVDPDTVPDGLYATDDLDHGTDQVIYVAVGERPVTGIDFGQNQYAFSGRVSGPTGQPLAGAHVKLAAPKGKTFTTTTGRDGSYHFGDFDHGPYLVPGKYQATVTYGSYAPYKFELETASTAIPHTNVRLQVLPATGGRFLELLRWATITVMAGAALWLWSRRRVWR